MGFIQVITQEYIDLILGRSAWIEGTCREKPARKHKRKGNVQFILWKAGEQGHKVDYWHDFDPSWWDLFKPNSTLK